MATIVIVYEDDVPLRGHQLMEVRSLCLASAGGWMLEPGYLQSAGVDEGVQRRLRDRLPELTPGRTVKLYLSSYRVGGAASRLLELAGGAGSAAIIANACDVFGDARLQVWDREATDLMSLGFDPEELDLRQYFGKPDQLSDRLRAYRLLWVTGGNAFVLARAMTACGFVEAFAVVTQAQPLVYGGYSAGACVTGPDLDGIHMMDTRPPLPEGYDAEIPARTLGWVPWRVVPHWRSDHPEAPAAEKAVEYMQSAGLSFRALRDGDVIVIDKDREV